MTWQRSIDELGSVESALLRTASPSEKTTVPTSARLGSRHCPGKREMANASPQQTLSSSASNAASADLKTRRDGGAPADRASAKVNVGRQASPVTTEATALGTIAACRSSIPSMRRLRPLESSMRRS